MFGIEAMQLYVPKTYLDQAQYQKYNNVSEGKYTKGLGQQKLSFSFPFQDINSISLTVVNNLMKNNGILPSQVGRLQVGTQTLVDKSKSTKTVLMQLFQGNNDIEGATSLNACYGATNALINTLNWISSPFWDGRYGIVVAADLAVYQQGPARPTGGAGAIALLIGPKAKITFGKQRASFIDHQWDFYKPIPHSEYPIVDGKLSIDCYLNSIEECAKKLKEKTKNENIFEFIDYYCFHAPFNKMVQKSFAKLMKIKDPKISDEEIVKLFKKKVQPSTDIPKNIGNIYTGSLYAGLISLLVNIPEISNKSAVLFSYGSGLCSTMLTIKIHNNPLSQMQIQQIKQTLQNRVKISPEIYTKVMLNRQQTFGKLKGKIELNKSLINDNVFYLKQIDQKWRRIYDINNPSQVKIDKINISTIERLKNLNKQMGINENEIQFSKFYKLSIPDRIDMVNQVMNRNLDVGLLQSGGLNSQLADTMIQNVIGTLSIPLAVVPQFTINHKKYMIPMCIQEASVVAAVSSIGKFLSKCSIHTSSTPNIMIGQVHLPKSEMQQIHKIISLKGQLIKILNDTIPSMVQRGGGVQDLRVRQLKGQSTKQYSLDIILNVCEAMGANITNTLCEKTKQLIEKMGIQTGIAILSNYCLERRALSYFEIQLKDLNWKGIDGQDLADKILQAYEFARLDKHRATTHNKGIMNGIDAVCVATGQDWRAVQSSAHAYACKTGQYMPLTHYEIVKRKDKTYFKGSLQIPIAVGTKGGVIDKNSIYKTSLQILGNPNAQTLSQILVSVGLAQNFAALRALAVEGIQKGHMVLHARAIAQKAGVPKDLIEDACKYMAFKKKYDVQTAKIFLEMEAKPKL